LAYREGGKDIPELTAAFAEIPELRDLVSGLEARTLEREPSLGLENGEGGVGSEVFVKLGPLVRCETPVPVLHEELRDPLTVAFGKGKLQDGPGRFGAQV